MLLNKKCLDVEGHMHLSFHYVAILYEFNTKERCVVNVEHANFLIIMSDRTYRH